MMNYIKIIRPINLLMVVLTQLLFWFCIIVPIHDYYGSTPDLMMWQVGLLILSTVLIAAGGYVINDYNDLPIDLVNKPDKVIVGEGISDDDTFTYFMVLTVAGLIASIAVAYTLNNLMLAVLPIVISSLLWFYAQSFKRMFLIGNLVVSIATAATIFLLIYFEVDWERVERIPHQAKEFMKFGGIYMLFAFVTSMLRELIKDLQDRDGDAQFDCRTLPIVAGEKVAKAIAIGYAIILLAGFGYIAKSLASAEKWLELSYVGLLLIVPAIIVIVKTIQAKESKHYNLISTLVKAIMFFGIITMIYIRMSI